MKLNVLYTSDNNYAPWLCVSVASLLENNKGADEITVYAVADSWDEKYVSRLEAQVARYGDRRHLKFIDGKEWTSRLSELGMLPYRGGQAPNLRLFFSEFIDSDVERLLYLDCDTIVCDDLTPLFQTDMKDKPIAVVLDSLTTHYRSKIGFSSTDSYFNSGVILFDVENWKKCKATERIMSYLDSGIRKTFINPDQDLLNVALKGQAVILHPRYNFQTTHKVYPNRLYFKNYGGIDYYTDSELDEARENSAILHAYRFLGQFPWHKNAIHPWRKIFLTYASMSECTDIEPSENIGKIFKLERFLYRILPKCIFIRIFKAWQNRTMKKHFKNIAQK